MKKRKWLSLGKKTAPELPLKPPIPFLENYSNGEFFHEQTPRDRLINKLVLEKADENSRKLGVDRRQFLASSAGMVSFQRSPATISCSASFQPLISCPTRKLAGAPDLREESNCFPLVSQPV